MTENKMTLQMLKSGIDDLLSQGYSPESNIVFVNNRYKAEQPDGAHFPLHYLMEFDVVFQDNENRHATIKIERNGVTFTDIDEKPRKTREELIREALEKSIVGGSKGGNHEMSVHS